MAGDPRDWPRFIVQVLMSLIFLGIGVWIIQGAFSEDLQRAACGWMGIILGYWLS